MRLGLVGVRSQATKYYIFNFVSFCPFREVTPPPANQLTCSVVNRETYLVNTLLLRWAVAGSSSMMSTFHYSAETLVMIIFLRTNSFLSLSVLASFCHYPCLKPDKRGLERVIKPLTISGNIWIKLSGPV